MLSYARTMIQDVITQLQSTGAGILSVLTNQWFLLGLKQPCVQRGGSGSARPRSRSGDVRLSAGANAVRRDGHHRGPDTVYGARSRQYVELCVDLANRPSCFYCSRRLVWCFGVLLDIMRRPFVMALFFGVVLGIAQCVALVVLLQEQSASLPETFSKVVAFAVISTFVVWRYAQAENGYSVLRISQLALAGLGLLVVGAIIDWTEIETSSGPHLHRRPAAVLCRRLADVDRRRPGARTWERSVFLADYRRFCCSWGIRRSSKKA